MARPKKFKNICALPEFDSFRQGSPLMGNFLETILTLEEYETIRLIDYESMTQEECSFQIGVSRPSVQLLYTNARKKISNFIVNGGCLKIEGGSYKICNHENGNCKRRGCYHNKNKTDF
ncbi:DUF134 domain-containing protein [Fusobacterium sp. IOR10]|uniref:DUF134 domain-containing protein n=1 Tax=Fusobacterium sp. IOR10 TaxID=2665157 RepID=UPI0013D188FD|nr:DUF134 domain-containing protein [Fusobacterium sp. IOR10]